MLGEGFVVSFPSFPLLQMIFPVIHSDCFFVEFPGGSEILGPSWDEQNWNWEKGLDLNWLAGFVNYKQSGPAFLEGFQSGKWRLVR